MKKIIVISGKQYSGKDTLAALLLSDLADFVRVGIGDAIKYEYAKKNGVTFDEIVENKHLYRSGLIELGNYGRSIDPDYWLKSIVGMKENVIVPDVRVEHEVELFKSYGAYSIRVEATYENRSKRAIITNADDLTETALDDYKGWDAIIDNNSDFSNLEKQENDLLIKIKKFFS